MKRVYSIILILLLLVMTAEIYAIPAFARRYKFSCTTCHAPFPKLKEFGEDFAASGMILKEEERDRDYIIAGDDLLRLNKDFPIAVRFEAFGLYDQEADVKTDLQTPWGVKLLSGGTLYKDIGYYFYFYMFEGGEVAGIEDAYIHFNNVGGSGLDIMVGQFQTSDPLMKRELRLTYEDYQIYRTKVGNSNTNLMFLYDIEKTGTALVAQVVNGNGKPEASEEKKFDMDSGKNVGLRVSQDVAGLFSIGGYYYTGTETLIQPEYTNEEFSKDPENEITYWGPDFGLSVGSLEIIGQYLYRKDTNPTFRWNGENIETKGAVLEITYSPQLDKSRYFLTALYNNVSSDMETYDYETATVSGTYLIARNLRLTLEYRRDLNYDENRFVVGLVSGF